MTLPTEPIGSIPRTGVLQEGTEVAAAGRVSSDDLEGRQDRRTPEDHP